MIIKDIERRDTVFKAIFVARGNNDVEKDLLLHGSNTVRHCSVRLLAVLSALMCLEVCTEGIIQAYLQFAS